MVFMRRSKCYTVNYIGFKRKEIHSMFGGVALVPEEEIMKKFISLRERYDEYFISPGLGNEENFPHMTLFQSYFDHDIDYHQVLHDLSQHSSENIKNMKIHHVGHVPKGWIFSYVHNNDDLQDLHCKSFKILRDHIIDEEIPREIDFIGFNENEKHYHLQYGYKYLFEQYRPHITIGVSYDDYIRTLDAIQEEYNSVFLDKNIMFDRMVFYEAGLFGTCKKVIDEIKL